MNKIDIKWTGLLSIDIWIWTRIWKLIRMEHEQEWKMNKSGKWTRLKNELEWKLNKNGIWTKNGKWTRSENEHNEQRWTMKNKMNVMHKE